MSKLSKLKKKKSQYVPEKDGVSGLDALMLNSLADGMAHVGAVSAAKTGKDWAYSEVTVIPGVTVSARVPPGMLIEMDGMTLVEEMVNAADRVIPELWKRYNSESSSAVTEKCYAHAFVGSEVGDAWSRKKATVAIVKSLLEMQGWKHVSQVNRWRSPTWLFPPIMLKMSTLEDLIRDEVDYREGSTPALEDQSLENPLDLIVG